MPELTWTGERIIPNQEEEFVDKYAILRKNLKNCLDLIAVCEKNG